MAVEVNKVIYSMMGVSKFYNNKPVLKDIYLSYFYGAKIGVIGLNGSGKSTLLRILAGVDKNLTAKLLLHRDLQSAILNRNLRLMRIKQLRKLLRKVFSRLSIFLGNMMR
jgi:energy-dependent translational throttle protein EttA